MNAGRGYSKKPDPVAQISDDNEARLLDDIEASTRNLYRQSRVLNEETVSSLTTIKEVEKNMEISTTSLNKEANHAISARKSNGGYCWMYLVIILELSCLSTLIYFGFS